MIIIRMCTPYRLTPREQDVAELLAAGLRQVDIAKRLVLSARTVGVHERNIMTKLGVNNRFAAAIMLHRAGLVKDTLPAVEPPA